MQHALVLLFFVCMPMFLSAQYERILKDRDVIWAAEIETTYNLEPPANPDSFRRNEVVFWKNYYPQGHFPYRNSELVMEKILAAERSGEWPASQRNDVWFRGTDTVVTFNVETLIETVIAVSNEMGFNSFIAIRAKQLLYYDQKKGEFGLFTSAIAPVCLSMEYFRFKGEWQGVAPYEYIPYWLNMPAWSKRKSKKKPKLNDPDIIWAAQIKTRQNSPVLDRLHILKNTGQPIMKVLLERFASDRRYETQNGIGEPISFNERHEMLFSADTTVSYHPITYKETFTMTDKSVTGDSIVNLRLVQDWFWDDRKKRLIIRLSGFAPIYVQEHFYGNAFEIPLFYRMKK